MPEEICDVGGGDGVEVCGGRVVCVGRGGGEEVTAAAGARQENGTQTLHTTFHVCVLEHISFDFFFFGNPLFMTSRGVPCCVWVGCGSPGHVTSCPARPSTL